MSNSFVTPWTVAHQAPLSLGFSRQEYWSGLPFLSPRDLPEPGSKPVSPVLTGRCFTTEPPGNIFQKTDNWGWFFFLFNSRELQMLLFSPCRTLASYLPSLLFQNFFLSTDFMIFNLHILFWNNFVILVVSSLMG